MFCSRIHMNCANALVLLYDIRKKKASRSSWKATGKTTIYIDGMRATRERILTDAPMREASIRFFLCFFFFNKQKVEKRKLNEKMKNRKEKKENNSKQKIQNLKMYVYFTPSYNRSRKKTTTTTNLKTNFVKNVTHVTCRRSQNLRKWTITWT